MVREPQFVVIVQNDSRKKFNLAIGPFFDRRAADFFFRAHAERHPTAYRIVPLIGSAPVMGPVIDVPADVEE